jgi:hypothetical protein
MSKILRHADDGRKPMDNLAALVGVVLLGLAVAGVPEESGVALIVGSLLVLAPTVAMFAGSTRAPSRRGVNRPDGI